MVARTGSGRTASFSVPSKTTSSRVGRESAVGKYLRAFKVAAKMALPAAESLVVALWCEAAALEASAN